MKNRILTILFALAFSMSAGAGVIEAELEASLEGLGSADSVPVIVRLSDTVDIKALRKDFAQTLKQQYPDPHERKLHRNALKRAMLTQRLLEKAARAEQPVLNLLQSRGEQGKMKSLWAINALAVTVSADTVADLAALPGVKSVGLDATVQGPGPSSAPTAANNTNLDIIEAPSVWQLGHTGLGVVVATMDTGVDISHPDLSSGYRAGTNSWFDPYGQHDTPGDHLGHGTQVMGLMVGGQAGGYQIGVAPEAQWIAAKIFSNANVATYSAIHLAYQWMLNPDGDINSDDSPDIVNNSWALEQTINQCNQEFSADIALLKEAEIAVVFSGGNYGPKSDSSVSPANDPSSLSVGSISDRLKITRSSSRGPGACDGGIYPRLVAPGDNILTSELMPNFYNVVSGTSFAVAHVSGAMAVLKGAYPLATVSELESALTETAVDLGSGGPDYNYGYGLIDMAGAYDWLAGSGGSPNPGSLQFSGASYSVAEDVASISVTVSRTGGSDGEVTVYYSTADGSATEPLDYIASSGTLIFYDGDTSRSIEITIPDDLDYEGDEDFTITLGNVGGGATLGNQDTAVVNIIDDEMPAVVDNDLDGYIADVDCNDDDASINPGATETKHDGIDQDCNGYDLTIEITRATYGGNQAVVWATSDLGGNANLTVSFELAGGGSFTTSMAWKNKNNRWEKSVKRFTKAHGAEPVSVTVTGVEGADSTTVQ